MYKESPLLKEQTDYFRDTRGNDGKERAGRGGRARGAQPELSCSHVAMSWAQTPGWAGQDAEQGSAPCSSCKAPQPLTSPRAPGGKRERGAGGWMCLATGKRGEETGCNPLLLHLRRASQPFCYLFEQLFAFLGISAPDGDLLGYFRP